MADGETFGNALSICRAMGYGRDYIGRAGQMRLEVAMLPRSIG